jgi:hypothetical protein
VRVSVRLARLALVLSVGCETPAADLRLTNGASLSSLVAPNGRTAVLIYDPAECLGCDATVAGWVAIQRKRPGSVRIVFTREPDSLEQRGLAVMRIQSDGVIQADFLRRHVATPVELVYERGRLVDSVTRRSGHQSLVTKFTP